MSAKEDEDEVEGHAFDPSMVDVGRIARWSVSSHKYGHDVIKLRDDSPDTFWQSEGPQPHYIDLAFVKKVYVSSVSIRCSHANDDSYTPKKISVSAGTGLHDVIEIRSMDLDRPEGWIHVPLRTTMVEDSEEAKKKAPRADGEPPKMREVDGPPIPCNYLRVQIMENHLNGKDTHVRGLRVFGLQGNASSASRDRAMMTIPSAMVTKAMQAEETHGGHSSSKKNDGSVAASILNSATEQIADADDGVKWMELGHDGLSDFTSLDFKMHETLR